MRDIRPHVLRALRGGPIPVETTQTGVIGLRDALRGQDVVLVRHGTNADAVEVEVDAVQQVVRVVRSSALLS